MFKFNKITLKQSDSRKKIKPKLLLIVLVVFVLIGLGAFFLKLYKNSKIIYQGDTLECVSEADFLNNLKNQNINFFTFDTRSIEAKVKKEYLCVDSVNIKRTLPLNLTAAVGGRKPKANIKGLVKPKIILQDLIEASASTQAANFTFFRPEDATISGIFIADIYGFLFKRDEDKNLETVYTTQTLALGDSLPPLYLENVFKITEALKKLDILPFSRIIDKDKLLIDSPIDIAMSLNKDYTGQIASLQLILQEAKINSEVIELIDLRFNKPIVIYSPKKK